VVFGVGGEQQVGHRRRGLRGPGHLENARPGHDLHLAAAGVEVVARPGHELHLAAGVEVGARPGSELHLGAAGVEGVARPDREQLPAS
jgi:hypothetical protein